MTSAMVAIASVISVGVRAAYPRTRPGACGSWQCQESGWVLTPFCRAAAARSTSFEPVVEGDGEVQAGGGAVDGG